MNTEPIIFKQGEENGIVIERENFAKSIFVNQYQQACHMLANLWKRLASLQSASKACEQTNPSYGIDNLFSNIIAFCGDRGEGKSSCMTSVATILTDKSVRAKAKKDGIVPIDSEGKETLPQPEDIDWLGIIDPSFFDEQHNILELMLGQMYAKASGVKHSDEKSDAKDVAYKRRRLMEQFQVVKNSICLLEPKEQVYDSISEMSDLAASIRLRSDITDLFKCYLDFMDKKCLLICVDDIDLNVKDAYKMSEMLRKYFVSPYCLVLVSVKVEQLEEVIAIYHEHEYKMLPSSSLQIAQKYVAKLFPRGNRVPMPAIEDICERQIKLAESYGEKEKGLKDLTVKERVVQLIFQKTGYVFYNGQYLSQIVPTNLRSLRHLLGTLESLPDARGEKGEDNEIGREVFKNYFFGSWAAQMPKEDYNFAQQLAEYTDLSTFNAYVVEYFAKRVKDAKIEFNRLDIKDNKILEVDIKFKEEEETQDDKNEFNVVDLQDSLVQLYNDIVNPTNTSTTISFGDVMYLLWLISTITVDNDLQKLVFFVRTVYSMRLYACYNEITADEGKSLFPAVEMAEPRINIHKADSLYDNVNRLQRFVNGSYFSYPQGALLSHRRDMTIIDFDKVKSLFNELKDANKNLSSEDKKKPEFVMLLQTCEFLAMCIVAVSTKENIEKENFRRISKTPVFLGTFNYKSHYALFDFLNPFYALCNLQYAYNRFDEILFDKPNLYNSTSPKPQGLLYKIANDNEESLLAQMKKIREGEYDWDMHGMLSDAVIRVSDIQVAIHDELLRQYRTHRVGSIAKKIYYAYRDIINLKITLYHKLKVNNDTITVNHEPHPIEFKFLEILCSFLYTDTNAARLDYILYVSPEEKWQKEIEAFMKNLNSVLLEILDQPKNGKEIKTLISNASALRDKQKGTFTRGLKNIFEDNTPYVGTDILQKTEELIALYTKARKIKNQQ